MKLFTIGFIFCIMGPVMAYLGIPYGWIPLVLAVLVDIPLIAIVFNIPYLGLLGARIEGGRRLTSVYVKNCYTIDTLLVQPDLPDVSLRVVHYRYSRKNGYYKIWLKQYPRNSKWIKNTNPLKSI